MREIPACGENRSLEGLSWPGEKAEAMRLREKEDAVSETARLHAHEWISQKTYKPRNEELAAWRSFLSAYLSIPLRSQEIQDTKAMVMTIIVFLIHKILFILTGRCQQVTPPAGTKGSIDTREGSK